MRRLHVILFSLLICSAAAASELVDVYRIDFGPPETTPAGYLSIGSRSTDERFHWKGRDLSVRDRGGDDLIARDFVTGARGELIVGLDNGSYEMQLVTGDSGYPHGPVDLFAQDQRVARRVSTAAGEFQTVTFAAEVGDNLLRVRFEPAAGVRNFVVNSMIIRGPVQQEAHGAFGPRPVQESPTLEELDAEPAPAARQALRVYCDWLVAHQQQNGFFDSVPAWWYRAAYPIRTLMAGYAIFGDPRYLRAVTKLLDQFVGEQLPNGAWTPNYWGRPVARRTQLEIEQAMADTTNLADSGAIATCLSVASRVVDFRRRKSYIDAHRRFADQYAARFQLSSGGFTNGRWQGQDMTIPYSVATGTQGMSFAALYAVTGEERYLQVAERAVRFLLQGWQQDGRPTYHDYATERSYPVRVTDFADVFYYHEAILWVWNWTQDEELKQMIRDVYGWHILGEKGLLRARQHDVWWPPTASAWENSKAGGMPMVLIAYDREMGQNDQVHEAVRRSEAFLSRSGFAERIGVMVDPDAPWGMEATTATGFAGLTLAELASPGLPYLRPSTQGLFPPGRWPLRGTSRPR